MNAPQLDRGRPRIVLGRFHDGSATPNWGGRATSLALVELAVRDAQIDDVVTLNGTFSTQPFETGAVPPRGEGSQDSAIRFGVVARTAGAIVAEPRTDQQRAILEMLDGADELWMNGEGDLILRGDRVTLARMLLIMEIALQLGCRVRLVNSMCSRAPGHHAVLPVVRRVLGGILSRCESVTYRDPVSLRLHEELFPDVPADWTPDALFTWASIAADSSEVRGPSLEGLSAHVTRFITDPSPYAVVSGSSARHPDARARFDAACRLATRLRDAGHRTLFVATDRPDRWLADVAAETASGFVDARVPLHTARTVLAGSRVLASGRYHPSILAYGAGVPCVMMQSNSHKTRSLQETMRSKVEEYPVFGGGDDDALADAVVDAAYGDDRARLIAQARLCAQTVRTRFAQLGVAASDVA